MGRHSLKKDRRKTYRWILLVTTAAIATTNSVLLVSESKPPPITYTRQSPDLVWFTTTKPTPTPTPITTTPPPPTTTTTTPPPPPPITTTTPPTTTEAPAPPPEPPVEEPAVRQEIPEPEKCDTDLADTLSHVAQAGRHIMSRFGILESLIGGRAPRNNPSDHPSGLALDFSVNRVTGDQIAEYVLENMDLLSVKYVIWRQRINHGSGWKRMEDRGGATANHYDHVHVSFDKSPTGNPTC